MASSADIERWLIEATPAIVGGFVHRVWRTDSSWDLLVRHHEGGDPQERAARRAVLEAALPSAYARCVAMTPAAAEADDKKLKKRWAKDRHPFLGLLRKHLVGARVSGLEQVEGERIVILRAELSPEQAASEEVPQRPVLVIELLGRNGNLILAHEDDPEATGPVILGSLYAGKARRPFERGLPYGPPPRRDPKHPPVPTIALEVEPDPEALPLGAAVREQLRDAEREALASSRLTSLTSAARKALKRCEGIAAKLEQQLAEVGKADAYEAEGDLIKANLGAIEKGMSSVEVIDYSSGEGAPVVLQLDPQRDALENMKARYKRAKKLRKGEANVLMRQGETDAQQAELSELYAELEALDPDDEEALDRLEAALRKRGALPKQKLKKQKQQQNQGPRSFLTKEGHEVLVGRSDEENDKLTMRIARGNDLFFHVAGCPGSHVILRVDKKRPPNHESLVDAGALAVHYSKARQRGKVDVHYTPRKWVKKPKGAKAGLVQISNFKTVRAGGDPERLERLFATLGRDEEDE